MLRFFVVLLVLFSVSACGGEIAMPEIPFINDSDTKVEKEPLAEVEDKTPSAQKLYKTAKEFLDKKRYEKAIENFQEIERVYPFDKLATKAQVMVAYANYKNEEYDDAVDVIDKYIRLNPGSDDTVYMYYLKALCYYDRIADVKRDQKVTANALVALKELVQRYPESSYARDASLKVDLVEDHLAGKHMEIGRFYLQEKKFIAAINRFKKVVDEYQGTNHIEEALYRLTETYLLLGLKEEAKKNAAVLGHNYPDSKWYRYAYKILKEGKNKTSVEDKSWWDFDLNFGGTKPASDEPLPKDNIADRWLDKIIDSF